MKPKNQTLSVFRDGKKNEKNNVACCDSANEPHIHLFEGRKEIVHPIDPIFSVTFFLKEGLRLPDEYVLSVRYQPDDLVISGDKIWLCIRENTGIEPSSSQYWRYWSEQSAWKDRWSPYFDYESGDIVFAAGKIYRCFGESLAGVHPKQSLRKGKTGRGRWELIGRIGSKLPHWINGSNSMFTADLNLGNVSVIHPASGGTHWDMITEKFIGSETVPVGREHPKIQKLFADAGETHVTYVYTVTAIHCGKFKHPVTDDNPNPGEKNFFGMTLGSYMVPPKNYVVVPEAVIGEHKMESTPTEGSGAFQSLMARISPQTGVQYTNVYSQWDAEKMPFVAQPVGDGPLISSFLCVLNREPHEKYTSIFEESRNCALLGNVMDTSPEEYKRLVMTECIVKGEDIPEGNMINGYKKWLSLKMFEKFKFLEQAQKKWDVAREEWIEWLWQLYGTTKILRAQCDKIAQDFYGVEKWIEMTKINYSVIKLNVGPQGPTSLQDIIDDIETIERLWIILENSIGGLTTYYIYEIQKRTNDVRSLLIKHNGAKTPKAKKRNGKKAK